MSDLAIKVENLGKMYSIRHEHRERYVALRDVITNKVNSFCKALFTLKPSATNPQPSKEDFWALKNVSFDVKQGDRIGIIGRNGAGKTTILKLLSRVTKPTTGKIAIKGRVASLLEVGTGFHPELTGKENIFLNGAILGMTKQEIKKKFDEIVDFAEIEKFLDTPVKRYSSGMYVRLAFAVAAHLEPEILLVDEVLAVGDAQFQKKCLGKMGDAAKVGKTILFVSHNMPAVKNLCNKGIVLEAGQLLIEATADEAIRFYMATAEEKSADIISFEPFQERPQFLNVKLASNKCNYGEYLNIHMELISAFKTDAGIEIEIHDERGVPIIYASTAPMAGKLISIKAEEINYVDLKLGPLNLATGDYFIYFWLIKPWAENYHVIKHPLKFTIEMSDPCNSGFDFKQSYTRGATTVPLDIL